MGTHVNLDPSLTENQFGNFRDRMNELYGSLTVTSEAQETFRYSRDEKLLGDLSFVSGMTTNLTFARTPRDIARLESDGHLKFVLPLTGAVAFRQNKREALVRSGQFYIDDTARPYEKKVIGSLTYLTVHFPRHTVPLKLGGLDSVLAIGFGADLPHGKLVRDFLFSLASVWNFIEEKSAAQLGAVASDLIRAALWERIDQNAPPRDVYRSAQFQQTKAFIDSHLKDPHLSLGTVAAALGVSTRYLRYLLSERGFSYRRYVLEQRLARCAKDLREPRLARLAVTDVAYAWGFADGPHLSRTFKMAYGMSPREYRASKLSGHF